MRTIIKYYTGEKFWSSIYILNEFTIEPGGFIPDKTFNLFLNNGMLKEVDHIEIIEIFYRHTSIISDCRLCKYYEIVKNIS